MVTVTLGVVPLTAQSGGQPLSLEKYMDMESVSNPQISPDGEHIVYTRGWIDAVNDARKSSLWIMDSDGSRNRHLLEGGGARWSPDGARILFTRAWRALGIPDLRALDGRGRSHEPDHPDGERPFGCPLVS
jgi:Tol biopolymer transport system component